jgi:hypothetical protein
MRISELLDEPVYDIGGQMIGRVHDIRLIQDAPSPEGQPARFRLDALLVGRTGLSTRLGYTRNEVRGPWLVKLIATRRERSNEEIPWSDVTRRDGRLIRETVG